MEIITGGVTAATGFEAASTAAGIKYQDRTDMALVYSQAPCVAAGTFTTNVVKAAPVKWDRQVIESGVPVQAVIVNSGIANACTGEEGFGYCKETAEAAAEALNIRAEGVTIGSTGVIGMQLPIEKVKAGIRVLAEKKNSSLDNGTIFINTKLKLAGNKSNFVSGSGNFSVVLYGNADVSLEASGSKFLPWEVICGRGRGVSEFGTGKRQLYQRIYLYCKYFKVDVYGREEPVICDGERQVE